MGWYRLRGRNLQVGPRQGALIVFLAAGAAPAERLIEEGFEAATLAALRRKHLLHRWRRRHAEGELHAQSPGGRHIFALTPDGVAFFFRYRERLEREAAKHPKGTLGKHYVPVAAKTPPRHGQK